MKTEQQLQDHFSLSLILQRQTPGYHGAVTLLVCWDLLCGFASFLPPSSQPAAEFKGHTYVGGVEVAPEGMALNCSRDDKAAALLQSRTSASDQNRALLTDQNLLVWELLGFLFQEFPNFSRLWTLNSSSFWPINPECYKNT